ncbi:hypothetical protein B7494_g2933 [Chlorociboria aeruginascens]|nr:hypothetical protein B7494_g2933 [Chlorociboria aeruginascens]
MSSDSLAAFRRGLSTDLQKLADEHLQHDLQESDRNALISAGSQISTYASIGSLLGLGLGAALAFRIRSNRLKLFDAFRTTQRPTHVKFADGREEAIPDIAPLLQPTRFGDIATYTFFGIAGLFLGGETGLLTGGVAARRTISRDPHTKARIERAFRGFKADVLRKEIEALEGAGDAPIW